MVAYANREAARSPAVRVRALGRGPYVDAVQYAHTMIARDLRAARVQAGLSQVELAKRMRRSQTLISLAEAGRVSVGERYVLAVLKACGLPPDWKPERTSRTRRKR